MSLASFFRWLPTPTYGKCGGPEADCSEKPVTDPMDLAFREHDQNCYQASLLTDPRQVKLAKLEADWILRQELLKIDPNKLNWYGKVYRAACLIIFK